MELKETLRSNKTVGLAIFLVAVVALAVLAAAHGGRHEERGRMGMRYDGKGYGMMGGGMMGGRMGYSGAAGFVSAVNGSSFTVRQDDGSSITVNTAANTSVQFLTNTLSPSSLKVGDRVMVLGSTNAQGTVDAREVRVLPIQSSATAATAAATSTNQ